jgi:type I restriction enzyme S subunit
MIDGLKPYPEYKDSGSRWLGAVPASWEVRNLRTLIIRRNERNRPDLPLLSVAREKGVFVRSLTDDNENHNVIPDDLTNYKVARAGNLVINKMKAWQGSMGIAPCDGIVSPAYFVFDFHIANHRFGQTLLRSKPYVAHFGQASDGVRVGQWDLSIPGMRQIPILIPVAGEQDGIVRFLDHANGRIERAIRAKQKLMALLNEQKQAIIHRAVTRGLNPNVSLKPSGIPWLGDIPKHWEMKRLKAIAQIRYGLGQPPRETETGLPLIRATNVDRGRILEKNLVRVDPADVPKSRNAFLKAGEIIVVRSGALTADSAIIPKEYEGAVAGYDMVVTVRRARPDFVALALLSSYVQDDQLIIANMRAAQPHLNAEELGTAILLLPPDEEQKQIVETVRDRSSPLDTALTRTEREIGLLREYRTRLVADVVTGKLDVRAAARQLPEAGGELSDGADQSDSSDSSDETPLE